MNLPAINHAATQENEVLQQSIKQLETSLARVQKLVVSKSDELAHSSTRSTGLEQSIRSLGSALLAQVSHNRMLAYN
jgi:hypothetical protein